MCSASSFVRDARWLHFLKRQSCYDTHSGDHFISHRFPYFSFLSHYTHCSFAGCSPNQNFWNTAI